MCHITQEEFSEVMNLSTSQLDIGDVNYIHCKNCIPAKLPAGRASADWGRLIPCWVGKVLSTGKKVRILTLRCWNCGRIVWDSRNILKEIFYGESEEGEKVSETGSERKV